MAVVRLCGEVCWPTLLLWSFLDQFSQTPEAGGRIGLHEYGTPNADRIHPELGDLGNIALLDSSVNPYVCVRSFLPEVSYPIQNFGYELATVEARIDC
jgi:hypothetical protein